MAYTPEKVDELRELLSTETEKMLGQIEMSVMTGYTLADAIREGCSVTEQAYNWGSGDTACALSAGMLAAKARGFM